MTSAIATIRTNLGYADPRIFYTRYLGHRVHSSSMNGHDTRRGGGKRERYYLPFKRRSEDHCFDLLSQSRALGVHRILSVRDIARQNCRYRERKKEKRHFEDAMRLSMRRRRRVMTFNAETYARSVTKRLLKLAELQQGRNCSGNPSREQRMPTFWEHNA